MSIRTQRELLFYRSDIFSDVADLLQYADQIRNGKVPFQDLADDDLARNYAALRERSPILFDDPIGEDIKEIWVRRAGSDARELSRRHQNGTAEGYVEHLLSSYVNAHPDAYLAVYGHERPPPGPPTSSADEWLGTASTVGLWLAAAVGSGVLGNAAYDLLKGATSSMRKRFVDWRTRPAEISLNKDEAICLALLQLSINYYRDLPEEKRPNLRSLVEVDSQRTQYGWSFILAFERKLFVVDVPKGDPLRGRVDVTMVWSPEGTAIRHRQDQF